MNSQATFIVVYDSKLGLQLKKNHHLHYTIGTIKNVSSQFTSGGIINENLERARWCGGLGIGLRLKHVEVVGLVEYLQVGVGVCGYR